MKTKVSVRTYATTEVDVELPSYGRASFDDSATHWVVDADLTRWSVFSRGGSVELEVERVDPADGKNAPYLFGLGEYAGSRDEYVEALNRAREVLARFPDPKEGP